jgi:hypothetical protein
MQAVQDSLLIGRASTEPAFAGQPRTNKASIRPKAGRQTSGILVTTFTLCSASMGRTVVLAAPRTAIRLPVGNEAQRPCARSIWLDSVGSMSGNGMVPPRSCLTSE